MVKTDGFYIVSPGDPSVGIYPSQWEVTGGFIFEDQKELTDFKKELKELFELVVDDHYVETFEERKLELEEERKMYNG